MGEKNIGKGIGPECKTQIPDTINVALCNRSEHGYHTGYGPSNDAGNAFKHFGDSVDIIIFANSGLPIIEEFFDSEVSWDIYYRSKDGIICIESSEVNEDVMPEITGKAAEYRRKVAVMCDPRTNTKVNLVWIDSQLGYLMNRAHYNGPYPVGMDLEEWSKEIYGQKAEDIPQCMACCLAQSRHETISDIEQEKEDVELMHHDFTERYPHARRSVFDRAVVKITNDYQNQIDHRYAIMNDIREDPHNEGDKPFIGWPMQYDWSEAYEYFQYTNIVQSGEIEWMSEYGRRVFEYCLLPYLMKDLPNAFDEGWGPLETWQSTSEDYHDWSLDLGTKGSKRLWRHAAEEKKDIICDALMLTMYEKYPGHYGRLKMSNGKTCEQNAE